MINQSSTTRIVHFQPCCWSLFGSSPVNSPGVSLCPQQELVGGSGDGGGAARLDVLQVARVAEKVAVQRVTAVTLLVVQLHLTFLTVIAFYMVVFVHGHNSDGLIRAL